MTESLEIATRAFQNRDAIRAEMMRELLDDLVKKDGTGVIGWSFAYACRVHGVAYGMEEIQKAFDFSLRQWARRAGKVEVLPP